MAGETLRIFISSPGDVGQERVIAGRVIERLQGEFAAATTLEPVLWEHEPTRATGHFQDQIVRPSETDIVVCILWSRLGTRLPEHFRRPDGTTFASGTEWEFEDAAAAYRKTGTPDLLVYRKMKTASADLDDEEELLKSLAQKKALDAFIKNWFGSAEDSFKAAFQAFNTPDEFETLLETHLRKLIAERLPEHVAGGDEVGAVTWHAGSPFRGLEEFDYEHAPVFFGRTRAVGEIREALVSQAARGTAFLLVFGMSGSGKSSLVRAGVLPTLCQPGVIERVGLWRWCIVRPSDSGDLFEGLAVAMLRDGALPEMRESANAALLPGYLRNAPDDAVQVIANGLDRAARDAGLAEGADAKLLLVVDQLEELFTREDVEPEHRRGFVRVLSSLANSGRVWVIGTMRSDFYHRCAEEPELVALSEGVGQYHLLPPTAAEFARMICGPAIAAGLRFEEHAVTGERLDDVLHAAATRDSAALPLLEFTLDELFKSRSDTGVLTHAAYDVIGGLEGALGRHAEAAFSNLLETARNAFPVVMRALVTAAPGDDGKVTSRPCDLARFEPDTPSRALVDALIVARMLSASGDSEGAQVRLVHEALLTHWPRALQQTNADRQDLQNRARLEAACTLWENKGRDKSLLIRSDLMLEETRDLLARRGEELDGNLVAFVKASANAHVRRQRLRLGLGAAAMFLLIVGTFFLHDYLSARQTMLARQQEAARNDIAGNLIAYAGSPGESVLDGDGNHGAYTEALLATLKRPELILTEAILNAHNDVLKRYNGLQTPQLATSLNGDVYLHYPPDKRRSWAFIVGVSDYDRLMQLKNPNNDARAMASLFRRFGYNVELHLDLTSAELNRAADAFIKRIREAQLARNRADRDEIDDHRPRLQHVALSLRPILKKVDRAGAMVMVYFAGNGVEIDGRTLFPARDAAPELSATANWFDINAFIQRLQNVAAARLVILDFCRTNPFVNVKR